MRWVVLLLCLSSPLLQAHNPTPKESRLALQKYGLAYCLYHYPHKKIATSDYRLSAAGYVEMYPIDLTAFEHISSFIDQEVKKDKKFKIT